MSDCKRCDQTYKTYLDVCRENDELEQQLKRKDDLLIEAIELIFKNGFNPLNGDRAAIENGDFLVKKEIQAIINKEKK